MKPNPAPDYKFTYMQPEIVSKLIPLESEDPEIELGFIGKIYSEFIVSLSKPLEDITKIKAATEDLIIRDPITKKVICDNTIDFIKFK